jgi:uncharacterized protein
MFGEEIKRDVVLRTLREVGCSGAVIRHSLAVERVALDLAKRIRANGHEINLGIVSTGALLHDIGRARTHGITHGIEGMKILKRLGLRRFVRFAECHLGSGIPAAEAREAGLPARDFVPRTLEEKVVTYADKLVAGGRRIPYQQVLREFESKLGPAHPAKERFEKLHAEIEVLLKSGEGDIKGERRSGLDGERG